MKTLIRISGSISQVLNDRVLGFFWSQLVLKPIMKKESELICAYLKQSVESVEKDKEFH